MIKPFIEMDIRAGIGGVPQVSKFVLARHRNCIVRKCRKSVRCRR